MPMSGATSILFQQGVRSGDGMVVITWCDPVDVVVQAPDGSGTCGAAVPGSFTPTYSGLTGGDTAPATPPICSTTGVGSDVGSVGPEATQVDIPGGLQIPHRKWGHSRFITRASGAPPCKIRNR